MNPKESAVPNNETIRSSPVDRFLGIVERAGNLLPHPATLFFLLTVFVVIASAVAAQCPGRRCVSMLTSPAIGHAEYRSA